MVAGSEAGVDEREGDHVMVRYLSHSTSLQTQRADPGKSGLYACNEVK